MSSRSSPGARTARCHIHGEHKVRLYGIAEDDVNESIERERNPMQVRGNPKLPQNLVPD